MSLITDPEELRRRRALGLDPALAPDTSPPVGPITGRPGIPQGWIGPGQYYAAGAAGSMTNIPGVNTTMGNTSSLVNQIPPPVSAIAQAVANARAAHPAQVDAGLTPPPANGITPGITTWTDAAGKQHQQWDQRPDAAQTTAELQQKSRDAYAKNMMIGENPNTHSVAYNNAGQPYLKTHSLEERAQGWMDGKVAAEAQIQTPGAQRPYIQAENVLQGYHPDDVFYTGDQSQVPKAARDAYRAMTKPIANRIREAMARRDTEFTSLDEVTRFVQDLKIDPLAGSFVGQTVTGLLQQHNPALYKQLVGDRKAQKANDAELVAHIRRTDPGHVGMPDDALLAHAKAGPAAMAEWENNPETQKYFYNEATGQTDRQQKRQLTPEEKGALVVKEQSVTTAAKRKMQDEEVANSIDPATGVAALTIGFKGGERQVMSIADAAREEHTQKLADEAAALKSKSDVRAERESAIKEKVAQAKIEWQRRGGRQVIQKEAQIGKDQEAIRNLEKDKALYDLPAWQELKKTANGLAAQHQQELDVLQKQAGPEPDESTVDAPVGADTIPVMTPEQVQAAPPGTRYRTLDGRTGTRP